MKKNIMFFTTLVILIVTFSSCGTTYYGIRGGAAGCGSWFPRKFENSKQYMRKTSWFRNSHSGRYRSGRF
jgi:hypothetical protein